MKFLLRLKHWQLFAIHFGVPILLQMILMVNIVTHIAISQTPGPEMFEGFFWLFPLIMLITIGTLFGWMWQVGVNLQKLLPEELRMKTTAFKIFLILPVVYITFFITGFIYMFTHIIAVGGDQPPTQFFFVFIIIFPLHLFSMFCMFYCIYFTARTLKTLELMRRVTASDYIGEFFLVWFFFVGVWILQPKINKLVAPEPEL
jgi:hypothetical protein